MAEGGTKEQAAKEFGWLELAEKEKFIVVFPQALPILPYLPVGSPTPASVPSWLGSTNDTVWWPSDFVRNLSALHHPDDGVFLTRLMAKIAAEKRADPERIFIAGFSSGGAMVADLAARFPDSARAFAAVAAVGGLRPARLTSPVSLLLFDGDADPLCQIQNDGRICHRKQGSHGLGKQRPLHFPLKQHPGLISMDANAPSRDLFRGVSRLYGMGAGDMRTWKCIKCTIWAMNGPEAAFHIGTKPMCPCLRWTWAWFFGSSLIQLPKVQTCASRFSD
jgi:predicted esterase